MTWTHNEIGFFDDQFYVKLIFVVVVILGAVGVIGWKYLPFT
jgi:predicted negative regulator of RcsB-dependent stress response